MSNNRLWVEKYRPKSLDQYIFQDEHQKQSINHMIEQQEIPHLLLLGGAGTGKTTLAKILISACGVDETDVLYLNGSDENGVDDIRNKVKEFASTFAFGSFKIVFIDEADYLSQPAQGTLRNVMEEYSESVRFIMTGNYAHKITPPIKSRCQTYSFKSMDKVDITEYCATILLAEKIKFDLDTLDTIVAYGYPDVRKIVNTLQQYSMSGKLQLPKVVEGNDDWKFKILDLLEENNWTEIRTLLCNSIDNEEWVEVYRFLYQNLDKSKKFKDNTWEEGIIIISEHLYQHSIVADPDINAAAMFIKLGQL